MYIDELLNIEKDLITIFDKCILSNNPTLLEIIERGFVYPKIESKKVLFVGINPSSVAGAKPHDHKTYKIEDVVKSYPRHYKKFQDIAANCGVSADWTYIDLFFFRETDQKIIDSFMDNAESIDFICKQLQLSFSIIEKLKPNLIIVCNSGGRQFFGIDKVIDGSKSSNVWLGYDFHFNNKFGVDVITGIHNDTIINGAKKTNLIGTPILFSSTLTYMDSSTKKRLEWQIRQILKYHSLFFGAENIYGHRSKNIGNQLKVLAQKLKENETLKSSHTKNATDIEAARSRDYELTELEEIIELLLTADK